MKKVFQTDAEEIWPIVESAKRQKHGTMLLFTENAPMESIRLSKAGYQVVVNGAMLLEIVVISEDVDVNMINYNYL